MIQAKVKCISVSRYEACESVLLSPVYSSDKSSPNYSWSQATPSGEVKLTITNPAAFGQFEPGKEYLIPFQPCE